MYLGGVGNDPRPNRAFNLTKQRNITIPTEVSENSGWGVLLKEKNADG